MIKLQAKSEEELLAMREVFTKRREKLIPVYLNTKITQGASDPNLRRRIRLGQIIKRCYNMENHITSIVDLIWLPKGVYRSGSVHMRKVKRRLKTTAQLHEIISSKRDPNSELPKILVGNAVLYEIPFEKLYTDLKKHRRLKVYAKKGLSCSHPECTRVASRILVSIDAGGSEHIDLFTAKLEHMNVDHINPLSKGGSDTLANKQPMCAYHNSKKGNKLI